MLVLVLVVLMLCQVWGQLVAVRPPVLLLQRVLLWGPGVLLSCPWASGSRLLHCRCCQGLKIFLSQGHLLLLVRLAAPAGVGGTVRPGVHGRVLLLPTAGGLSR